MTNPERFAPLIPTTLALIDDLCARFDVARAEGEGIDEELERDGTARPSVRLVPRNGAAPLTFVFMTLPGVAIRFGRWSTEGFPDCACDACDASAEGSAKDIAVYVDAVVTGGFIERLRRRGVVRRGVLECTFVGPRGNKRSWGDGLEGERLDMLLQQGPPGTVRWGPW